MSPEALQDTSQAARKPNGRPHIKLGRASDVWSLGCILYQMVYGKTPFSHITSLIHKLQAIVSPSHEIEFPPLRNPFLLDVLKRCLDRDPARRPPICGPAGLLSHPFLDPTSAAEQGALASAAAAPGSDTGPGPDTVQLSQDQLVGLLRLSLAVPNSSTAHDDADDLAQMVFKRIRRGGTPAEVAKVFRAFSAQLEPGEAAAPPHAAPSTAAGAATGSRARAAGKGGGEQGAPTAGPSASPAARVMSSDLQASIRAGKDALKPVCPPSGAQRQREASQAPAEGDGMRALFAKGLAKMAVVREDESEPEATEGWTLDQIESR